MLKSRVFEPKIAAVLEPITPRFDTNFPSPKNLVAVSYC